MTDSTQCRSSVVAWLVQNARAAFKPAKSLTLALALTSAQGAVAQGVEANAPAAPSSTAASPATTGSETPALPPLSPPTSSEPTSLHAGEAKAIAETPPVTPRGGPSLPEASASGTSPNSTSALLRTALGLLAVLGLLGGILWLMRRFGMVQHSDRSVAKVVGAVSVGNRERVVVVEVAGQWIVVGVASGRVNGLAQMPAHSASPLPDATLPPSNFSDWLRQTIQQRQGKTGSVD